MTKMQLHLRGVTMEEWGGQGGGRQRRERNQRKHCLS